MAFSTQLVNPYTSETYASYSRVFMALCNKTTSELQVLHYASEIAAKNGSQPVSSLSLSAETDLDLQAANPIAYAYQLLEASGQFPDATWNI